MIVPPDKFQPSASEEVEARRSMQGGHWRAQRQGGQHRRVWRVNGIRHEHGNAGEHLEVRLVACEES